MTTRISDEEYFLSASNPAATADQIWTEQKVLNLLQRDDVQGAIVKATYLWRLVSDTASEQALSLLEEAIREFGVNYCFKAANSDANHPRIVQDWMVDHEWFGLSVPAARIGGDNPDNSYRLVPVEHGASYRIDGQMFGDGPADLVWSIVANAGTSMTTASLQKREMAVGEDGRFTITIDGQPANGRPNHLQTQRDSLFLFVRDSISDWERERPNRLRVTRLSPPSAAPIDEDEMAWRAIDWMLRDVSLYHWFTMLSKGKPVNTLIPAEASGAVGGVSTQYGSYGQLRIADDEAFVVKVNEGGGTFRNMVAHDWWFRTIEPERRLSSRNNSEIAADEDGNFTFIISHADPGIHNWIDTAGLRDLLLLHRWQNVSAETAREDLPRLLNSGLVKFADIDAHTQGAKRVTPAQRQQQLQTRQAQYRARLSA